MSCAFKVRKSFWETHTLRTRVLEYAVARACVRTRVCASVRMCVFVCISRLFARVRACSRGFAGLGAFSRVYARLGAFSCVASRAGPHLTNE